MALVRILIDGYSLLHQWPELAPGQPRHSARAREALVEILTHYQDAAGTPVTVFFDGSGKVASAPRDSSTPAVEVLFSHAGHRFQPYGEVMVVTDDRAERDTVTGFGGTTSSCANFIRTIGDALDQLAEDLQRYNLSEKKRFSRGQN